LLPLKVTQNGWQQQCVYTRIGHRSCFGSNAKQNHFNLNNLNKFVPVWVVPVLVWMNPAPHYFHLLLLLLFSLAVFSFSCVFEIDFRVQYRGATAVWRAGLQEHKQFIVVTSRFIL
jgi:hypothetical protein